MDEQFQEYGRRVDIKLPVVYQEMDAVPCRSEKNPEDRGRGGEIPAREQGGKPLMLAAGEEERKHLVILGDPGSGKSMFIDNLAWHIARTHLGETDERLPPLFRHRPLARVRLRSAALLLKREGREPKDRGKDFIRRAIRREIAALVGEEQAEAVWQALEQGLFRRGVILLDGVDEVPEADGLRSDALEAIDLLAGELKGSDTRLIVTSRPYAFERRRAWLDAYACLDILPMGNERIEAFVQHWYRLMRAARPGWTEQTARKKAEGLFTDLQNREGLLEPSRRPLLLTLLTSLHFAHSILPHNRAELYQKAIKLMLERWTQRSREENPDYPLEPFERKAMEETDSSRWEALQQLALEAHRKQDLQISATDIKGLFSGYLSADCNPNNLLDFLRYRSGILKPGQGEGFELYHRSFQDYLAASAITELDDWQDVIDGLLRQENGGDWWGEVYLLLVSIKVFGGGKPDAVNLMRLYIQPKIDFAGLSEPAWTLLFLAARAMVEQRRPLEPYYRSNKTYRQLFDHLEGHLRRLVEREHGLPVARRAEAGRLLGELGDPRPGIATLRDSAGKTHFIHTGERRHAIPDIDWVEIPGGRFAMGSGDDENEALEQEKPAHEVEVSPFRIGRWPVTNAQYACFVEAGGYDEERHWRPRQALEWLRGVAPDLSLLDDRPELKEAYEKGLEQEKTRKKPWFWEQRKWNNPNHPVGGVPGTRPWPSATG